MLGLALVGTIAAAGAAPPKAVCIDHLEMVGIEATQAEVRARFEEAIGVVGAHVAARRKNRCPEGSAPIGISLLRVGPMLRVDLDLPGADESTGLSLSLEGSKALPDKEALAEALRPSLVDYVPEPELLAPSGPAPTSVVVPASASPAPSAGAEAETKAAPHPERGAVSAVAVVSWVAAGTALLASVGLGIAAHVTYELGLKQNGAQRRAPQIYSESRSLEYVSAGVGAAAGGLAGLGLLFWLFSGSDPQPASAGATLLTGGQTGVAVWWNLP